MLRYYKPRLVLECEISLLSVNILMYFHYFSWKNEVGLTQRSYQSVMNSAAIFDVSQLLWKDTNFLADAERYPEVHQRLQRIVSSAKEFSEWLLLFV